MNDVIESFYEGVVEDNNDPQKLGRIKVSIRALTGYGTIFPGWVSPAGQQSAPDPKTGVSSGSLWVPPKGSVVLVLVLEGSGTDRETRETMVGFPRARYFSAPYISTSPPPAELTGTNYPNVRGFVTPAGTSVVYDDVEKLMKITTPSGNSFEMNDTDKAVTATTPGGHIISLDDATGEVTISRGGGPQFMKMHANGNVTVHGSNVNIGDGADYHLVRGEELMTFINTTLKLYIDSHTHLTPVGSTSPPVVPQPSLPSSALSSNHKVK